MNAMYVACNAPHVHVSSRAKLRRTRNRRTWSRRGKWEGTYVPRALGNEKDREDKEHESGPWKYLSEKLAVKDADGQPLDAKDLLKKYGAAYIVSSLSLSLVSFSFFYVLFSSSVDTGKLIEMTNLKLDERAEKASTAALAYAAHKAASPLRFPPTVAITPAVAKILGRKEENEDGKPSA